MKKIAKILVCLFSWSGIYAQDQNCDISVIMNVKGKWVKTEDNIVDPDKTFPRNQYSQLNSRVDKIAALFQQTYPQPAGIQAKWYRYIRGSSLVKNGPVPYGFRSLYDGWYCNQKLHKLMLSSITGTWANVHVNEFGWFMTVQSDELKIKIEGTTAFLLPKKIGQWNGLPLYEKSGYENKSWIILITRNNQLPYKPVSRSQFLKSIKENQEADKKVQIDFQNKLPVRSDAEEEEAKQKGLAAYSKQYPGHEASYLKSYKTAKQRKEENIQRTEKFFDDRIKVIDDVWRSLSEDQLKEPAIVNSATPGSFKGFTSEEKGGRMIVFINYDYFNLKLPRYVPQMIVLYLQWDPNPAALNFKKQMDENFPLDQLKSLIDK